MIAILNDNKVWIYGLVDTTTGAYVNNAALTFSVTDKSGNTVASGIAMSYQSGSNGNYVGILPGSTSLSIASNPYSIVVTAAPPIVFSHTIPNVNAETG